MNNNAIVTAFAKTGAGGTIIFVTDNGSTVTGAVSNCQNNNFSNVTLTGATAITGINYTDGGTAPTRTVSGNTLSNWTTGAATVNAMNFTYWNGVSSLNNNTITNINGQGAITAITIGSSVSTATSVGITANTINNLISTGTGGAVTGITSSNTSTAINISGNLINTLSSTGAAAVSGIVVSGATANNVFKNKICDLSGSNASSTVNGILASAGSTNTIYNNLIGDLRAPAANAANPVVGLNLTGGTTANAYYNTVYLNASSSGALFGSSAVSASTTPTVTLRNNIFYNNSSVTGAGLAAAYRRSTTTLTSYGATSNNNLFAGSTIFTDGTNTDATIAAYKARVASRDASSINEDLVTGPTFLSTTCGNSNFLHISTSIATQLESGAASVAGITDDFDGDVRSGSTPDIGADEFAGIAADFTPPSINYTPLTFTCGTGNRSLTASITDASGVPTSGAGLPVLYWKINAGAYTAVTGTFVSGNNYQFSFGAGVSAGDVVSYYIVAQDNAGTPNVGSFPSAGASGFTANPPAAATPTTSPSTYSINIALSGTKTVGASGADYATLNAAFNAYNTSCLAGPVVFSLLDAAYTNVSDTLRPNADASAVNTLTIKPTQPVTAINGNTTAAPIVLYGADYIIIDGSTSATVNSICPSVRASRNLTINNANTGTSSAVVWLASNGTDGASNNIVKNCNIAGASSTTTLIGIGAGSGATGIAITSLGTGNNNNTFENNNIKAVQFGIYSQGASAANKNSGNQFNMNLINTKSGSSQNVRTIGILAGFENSISVSGNNIGSISGGSLVDGFGISLGGTNISTSTFTGNEVINATITDNIIDSVRGASTFSVAGIFVANATNSGTNLLANNAISNVATNGTLGDFGTGIAIGGGAVTTNIYNNSVSASGTLTSATQPNYAIVIAGANPVVTIKNNVFYNSAVNGGGTGLGVGAYAIGFGYATPLSNLTIYNNDYFTTGAEAKFAKTGSLASGSGADVANLAALQTATAGDANSISADPLFNSASNLQPQTGSPVVGAGATGTGITTDVSCNIRTSPPAIGAYDVAADNTPPVITYTALANTLCATAPTLAVTITDASGVNVAPGTAPRMYYRKGGAAAESDVFGNYPTDNNSTFNGWKYVEATGTAPNFSFTPNFSLLSSAVASGDSITYFIVAQDLAGTPNVGKNTVTFNGGAFVPTSVNLPAAGASPTSGSLGYRILSTIPTVQSSTAAVVAGSINNIIMRLDVPPMNCGSVTQIDFTNVSTDVTDIAKARVYYTTSTTFATTTQFGTDVVSPGANFSVSGTQATSNSLTNYFWLVYDVNCAAPTVAGNVADGGALSIVIGGIGYTPTPGNPTGTRAITSLSSSLATNQPSTTSIQAGSSNVQVVRLDLPATGCGTITQVDFNTTGTSNVADITKARVYYTTTTTFATTTQFGADINNPSGALTFTGSQAASSSTSNYFWLVYDLNCAGPATAGNVVDASATSVTLGGNVFTPTTSNPTGTRTITALSAGVSTTQTSTASVQAGTGNQQIVRIEIPANSCGTITQVDFSTTGTTDVTDVTKARVYYTTSTTFATTTQFGSDISNPSGNLTFTGSLTPSAASTNYFWLVYDISCSAPSVAGNVVDGAALSITLGGTPYAPATTNPTGTRTIVAQVAGDNIGLAATAVLGSTPTNNPFVITGRTLETGEPSPILNSQGGSQNGRSNYSWGTAASSTYWYKLVVPTTGYGSSGNLIIRATTTTASSSVDAQVAVWEFPGMTSGCGTAANFTGAKLLQANDDKIATGFSADGADASFFNPAVRCRLTPGNTYYIQVDGFGTATPDGNLLIEDLADPSGYNVANNGLGNYFNPASADMRFASYEVNGTDGWTYYYDNNGTDNTVTDDKVLMALNWNANNFMYGGTYQAGTQMANHLRRDPRSFTAPSALGTFTSSDSIIVWVGRLNASAASADLKPTAPYVTSAHWWMMNKFWNLLPKIQPSSGVSVRTFYSNADFTALQTVVTAGGGILANHSDMQFIKATKSPTTHYSNAEVDPGGGQAALTLGTVSNLVWANTDNVETGADPINQAQFNVTAFSGGGGGSTGTLFPLSTSLLSFSGEKAGSVNKLHWTTVSETRNRGFDIQRSLDGIRYTSIGFVSTLAPGGTSNGRLTYEFTDNTPTGSKQYYRLREIDLAGVSKLSSVVLIKGDKPLTLVIDGLYPNPANAMVNVLVGAPGHDNVTLVMYDVSGKAVIRKMVTLEAGSNTIPVDISRLTNGSYIVKLVCASNCEMAVSRFVKQ